MSLDQGLFLPAGLGILEGLTEFVPVSSTAHLLLAAHFLGFSSPGDVFEVLIQLGAILAIVVVYFGRIAQIVVDALSGKSGAWRFILGVVLAALPASVAGFLLHDVIKNVLFQSPILICAMLIAGGIVLLYVDQLKIVPKYTSIYEYPPLLCLYIGLFQVLSLVPGVSRSGSTIVGSLLLGTDKRSAAEFSFFVAIPLMIGAFALDFWKNRALITGGAGLDIAIGFAFAFVAAFFVVRYALSFIQRNGFAFFAYWRIFVGAIGLWGVLLIK
jgi:undecaprenyl-diphosphatase